MRTVDFLLMVVAIVLPFVVAMAVRRRRRESRAIQEKLDRILERLESLDARKR